MKSTFDVADRFSFTFTFTVVLDTLMIKIYIDWWALTNLETAFNAIDTTSMTMNKIVWYSFQFCLKRIDKKSLE